MTGPTNDSLIVEAANEDAQPLHSWEGAGLTSSIADLNAAWSAQHPDPLQIGFAAAGATLDGLDTVLDPLGGLARAGIGWLIEHVWWLHEPLDALAGDPTQISAQAQTWHNVAAQLAAVAGGYRDEIAAGAPDWDGVAADAYRVAVADFTDRLDAAAGMAERLSSVVLLSGAAVAALRTWVRDMIADFVWQVLQLLFWAGALAFLTFGGALAAGAVQAILRAIALAQTFVRQISRLLDVLSASGQAAHQLVEAMRGTVAQARAAAPVLRAQGETVLTAADGVRAGNIIETGKQVTNAGQNQRGWDDPAPA